AFQVRPSGSALVAKVSGEPFGSLPVSVIGVTVSPSKFVRSATASIAGVPAGRQSGLNGVGMPHCGSGWNRGSSGFAEQSGCDTAAAYPRLTHRPWAIDQLGPVNGSTSAKFDGT